MEKLPIDLLDPKIPLVFSDGSDIYSIFTKEYGGHSKGYFIMAPSGAGKSYYVRNQVKKQWVDGDDLWMATNAHPAGEWWLEGIDVIDAIDARCDVVTQEAKRIGLWVVGASNNWLRPDAIVIPEWETHKKWISDREKNHYDGGATTDRLDQVMTHREWILRWEKKGVPKFETVQAAAEYLASL